MTRLSSLDLDGFKSIRRLSDLRFGDLNILIGPNGAGKSNLIGFFKLLSWMMPSPGHLQFYVGKIGGANAVLHDGAAVTPQIAATLTFDTDQGTNQYSIRLFHGAPDTLIFAEERFRFYRPDLGPDAAWTSLGSGHRESRLIAEAEKGKRTAKFIVGLLRRCTVHQFHNTSETARMKSRWNVDDSRFLKEDAANLAPFLYRLRESRVAYYSRIVETLRQIAPFFADFVLEPADGTVMLQWRERDSDLVFGPQHASDGSLRVFALIALLLQPEDELPEVLILDEPELGLHPYAIRVLAGVLRSVAAKAQIIVSTQSMTLIDHFDPEHIIVVDRPGRESTFTRLEPERLTDWLHEYSLAELWEKNVIGGRPAR